MKISVDVEATPKELREFLGLPDIQPLQDEMLDHVRQNMQKGLAGLDPSSLLKTVLPENLQALEAWQRTVWDAFSNTARNALRKSDSSSVEPGRKKGDSDAG